MREKLFALIAHFVFIHAKGKIEINFDGSGKFDNVKWVATVADCPSKEIFK